MDVLKVLNLLVRFLLELSMLAAVGYWGFKTHPSWAMKILFGVGLPILIAVLWGVFVSPKATYPLKGLARHAVEFTLLGSGAIALYASGLPNLAWIYIALVIANKALMMVWKQ